MASSRNISGHIRYLAEQGFAEAQFDLGFAYATGREVSQDDEKAVEWYRRSADQGNWEALTHLGSMYAEGRCVPQDDAEAVRLHLLAAEQGNGRAQFLLGLMYARGRGVPKGHGQAMEWYGRAAEQGVPYHHRDHNMRKVEGLRYDKGRGARQHNARVVKDLQSLAGVAPDIPPGLKGMRGNTRAQFNLGVAHAAGCGVPQDDLQAQVLFNVVASRLSRGAPTNRKLAVSYREVLAREMSPSQVADAERLAREQVEAYTPREKAHYSHDHLRTALYLEAMQGIAGPTVRVQTSLHSSGRGKDFTVVVDDELAAYRRLIQAEVSAITNKTSDTGNILLAVNEQGTYTRTDGSYLDDGFAAQNVVEISGFKHKENNGRQRVSGVTARVLSVDFPEGFKAEQTVARIRAFGGMIDLPFE